MVVNCGDVVKGALNHEKHNTHAYARPPFHHRSIRLPRAADYLSELITFGVIVLTVFWSMFVLAGAMAGTLK